jgi:protein-disulfide reductase (glutathione)
MVNLGDKDEPNEAIYKPDGGYIPRVLFFHPDGSLLKDIINDEGNEKYKYYHFSTETIVSAMRQVLKLSENWSRIPSEEL